MKKIFNFYFLYDDNFVVREILWNLEDAEKMSKFYSCNYAIVRVKYDSNSIDPFFSFPHSAYPNIDSDGYDIGYDISNDISNDPDSVFPTYSIHDDLI